MQARCPSWYVLRMWSTARFTKTPSGPMSLPGLLFSWTRLPSSFIATPMVPTWSIALMAMML